MTINPISIFRLIDGHEERAQPAKPSAAQGGCVANLDESVDLAGELAQLFEVSVEDRMNAREIQAQIAVHERIAKRRERSLAQSATGTSPKTAELVDGGRVVGRVDAGRWDPVRRDVEHTLHRDLQTALDDSELAKVREQQIWRHPTCLPSSVSASSSASKWRRSVA